MKNRKLPLAVLWIAGIALCRSSHAQQGIPIAAAPLPHRNANTKLKNDSRRTAFEVNPASAPIRAASKRTAPVSVSDYIAKTNAITDALKDGHIDRAQENLNAIFSGAGMNTDSRGSVPVLAGIPGRGQTSAAPYLRLASTDEELGNRSDYHESHPSTPEQCSNLCRIVSTCVYVPVCMTVTRNGIAQTICTDQCNRVSENVCERVCR